MPLTFIDIERQKNWRIALFFGVLLLVYFGALAALGLAFNGAGAGWRLWAFLGGASFTAAAVHFWFSASGAVDTVLRQLDARPPDREDDIHRMFSNIIEEVHVVTGRKRAIQCAVIPSLSLNALAAADLKGNALIAITEGLLSRLTRPQVEAVVCHEAHHILSGDCLETTAAASIFGTFSSALEKFRYASRNNPLAVLAFLLAWLLLQVGMVLNFFISREREYRADAASVRMTRNPLALAETLHLLSRSWRGAGFIGGGLGSLCIVSPRASALDEADGFVADLLSTHPPVRKRMGLLLDMARVSIGELDRRAAERQEAASREAGQRYFAMSPGRQWEGPFTLAELADLSWLSPLTWVAPGEGRTPARAWNHAVLDPVFLRRLQDRDPATDGFSCPSCRQPLLTGTYEGTRIRTCGFCAGTLVENDRITRIIARTGRERPCSERINALARTVLKENQSLNIYRRITRSGGGAGTHLPCPKCGNPMHRGFYSQAHLVEVDRCSYCGHTWFDRDELEMLQCMIENRLIPHTDGVV